MNSFFCQRVIDASEKVSEAIYDCGWENFQDEKIQKIVLFALLRAQREERFRILDYWTINLELFGDVRRFFCRDFWK